MKTRLLLSIALLMSISCAQTNQDAVFYKKVERIYADFNRIYWDYFEKKDTSILSTSKRMKAKMNELEALKPVKGGEALKEKALADMHIWQQTFELTYKLELPGLSGEERGRLLQERLNLQTRRNPANDSFYIEKGKFLRRMKQ